MKQAVYISYKATLGNDVEFDLEIVGLVNEGWADGSDEPGAEIESLTYDGKEIKAPFLNLFAGHIPDILESLTND